MSELSFTTAILALIYLVLHLIFIVRAIVRPHREAASRVAWVLVILIAPWVGIIAYILLGETYIGRKGTQRRLQINSTLSDINDSMLTDDVQIAPSLPERYKGLFKVGYSINQFPVISGNQAHLTIDSNNAIDLMVSDIDNATDHVHLLFYIWLPDNNGLKVINALKRAVKRRVACRVMVDALGSRIMITSQYWSEMQQAGVHVATALPIGNPFLRPLRGRIDLRNHRKMVIIDHDITYCGSQNCSDPEFRVKKKYAPWVDIMIRFKGPIARQNQQLFVRDWMSQVDQDLTSLLSQPLQALASGFCAQVIGTGPTVRNSSMPEIFATLMYSARDELVVSTPYYVPDEVMQQALCATALRGVNTILIVPAKNDSWIVQAASRSYYHELLTAGVKIYEFQGGLLHSKTLTLDGDVALIGSANMDRRSFELNYENNILLYNPPLTKAIRQRQETYIASSQAVIIGQIADWPLYKRLYNNTIAMLGPIL